MFRFKKLLIILVSYNQINESQMEVAISIIKLAECPKGLLFYMCTRNENVIEI